MRRGVRIGASLLAGLAVVTAWRVAALDEGADGGTLPPTSIALAYHIHTTRSDGTGTVEHIAAAAAAAGVRVVVLTDHGDGTRPADPPRYLSGVLVLDGVEVSTWGGHYVALGARPSSYPLGGEPNGVAEDVARLGGFGVVAHPGSSKDQLRWRAWDAAFDGLEWLNADSEWRDRPRDLWAAVLTYPWQPASTVGSLMHRPLFELGAWDRQAAQRPVVALGAHDAHARLGLGGATEPYDGWVALRVPGYASMFRAFVNVVQLPRPLGAGAERDAETVLEAIRRGSVYTAMTMGHAAPHVQLTATSGGRVASIGQHLASAGPVTFASAIDAPPTAESTLVCDGQPVASAQGGQLTWTTKDAPGACRLEVTLGPGDRAPWVLTNPIYVRSALVTRELAATLAPPRVIIPFAGSGRPDGWTVEASSGSTATLRAGVNPGSVDWTWRLGASRDAFAAVRVATPAMMRDFDRVIVRATADRPIRLWVQLRVPADGGRRWGRSVFLDQTQREVALPFASFLPLDPGAEPRVPLHETNALLLVVDTVHARPGTSGSVTFEELRLGQ